MGKSEKWILGIDIGGTRIRLGFVNKQKELKSYKECYTSSIFSSTVDNPTEILYQYIHQHLLENKEYEVEAVSIGVPSTVSRDGEIIIQTPNIPSFPDNYPLLEELSALLDLPVFVLRDVNGHLLYDMWDLGIPDDSIVAGIYFGTGVGNAIQIQGNLLLGKNGVAAELGHIPTGNPGQLCTCGNKGCVETTVSGIALQRLQEKYFPDTFISKIFLEHKNEKMIHEFVDQMSCAVTVEINLLDPDFVILGGGLLQMKGFPFDVLESCILEHSRKPFPYQNLALKYSRPTQTNGVIGSAIYAFGKIKNF